MKQGVGDEAVKRAVLWNVTAAVADQAGGKPPEYGGVVWELEAALRRMVRIVQTDADNLARSGRVLGTEPARKSRSLIDMIPRDGREANAPKTAVARLQAAGLAVHGASAAAAGM